MRMSKNNLHYDTIIQSSTYQIERDDYGYCLSSFFLAFGAFGPSVLSNDCLANLIYFSIKVFKSLMINAHITC